MDEDGGGEGGGVPEDLSLEEREELLDIRRRKKELIDDIERLKYEIAEVMTEIDNLTSVEESKTTQRNKQIAMGRKKFNMDPKKGIQFLIENDLLQSSPEDVAQFLYKGEGLNKTVIGDYLGERDEFNIKVLQAFVELHEFADLNLVQALRQFLWSFRLPGEAQKIDRMMEAFASRYCLCNPGVFQSTDTCYVLSFAIIMLNTSLHNHNVRDKPTAERFITMNRGINEGGDLPEELLRNLYESIKNEPFKIPEDDGNDLTHTFFNPDREGWLLKLGGRYPVASSPPQRLTPPSVSLPHVGLCEALVCGCHSSDPFGFGLAGSALCTVWCIGTHPRDRVSIGWDRNAWGHCVGTSSPPTPAPSLGPAAVKKLVTSLSHSLTSLPILTKHCMFTAPGKILGML
uniref:cytohesin-3 isoform X1 n=1 Tax=Urocitellus parryii TaxID=9999 RepID=UPI000E55E1AE|nr:cytohesin-3 isoform X1 [Urocitellus parryii]